MGQKSLENNEYIVNSILFLGYNSEMYGKALKNLIKRVQELEKEVEILKGINKPH